MKKILMAATLLAFSTYSYSFSGSASISADCDRFIGIGEMLATETTSDDIANWLISLDDDCPNNSSYGEPVHCEEVVDVINADPVQSMILTIFNGQLTMRTGSLSCA